MPGIDGLAAAETIYNELQIPVVMLSAYSDPEYVSSGNRIGVFGYLTKPVSRDQLRVGLEVAWSRYLRQSELSEEVDSLKERLKQRKVIEQAKWIIVKRKSVEEPEAMRLLLRTTHNLAEPAGAGSIAGLAKLANRLHGRTVAVILTGANVDEKTLRRVLNREI